MADVIEWLKYWYRGLVDYNDKEKEEVKEKIGKEKEKGKAPMSISETELMVDVIEWLKNWFISLMDFNDKKEKRKKKKKKGEEEEGKGEEKKN